MTSIRFAILRKDIFSILVAATWLGCSHDAPSPEPKAKEFRETESPPNQSAESTVSPDSPQPKTPPALAASPKPKATGLSASELKPDPDLQGIWRLYRIIDKNEGGNKSYLMISSPKIEMTIEGSNVKVRTQSEDKSETEQYVLDVDQSKTPKVFRRIRLNADASRPDAGIYSVEKDTLQMCQQANGTPPESFTVVRNDGKNRQILEYQRVRDSVDVTGTENTTRTTPGRDDSSKSNEEDVPKIEDLVGEWEGPDCWIQVEPDGKGKSRSFPQKVLDGVDPVGNVTFELSSWQKLFLMDVTVLAKDRPLTYGFFARPSKDKLSLRVWSRELSAEEVILKRRPMKKTN